MRFRLRVNFRGAAVRLGRTLPGGWSSGRGPVARLWQQCSSGTQAAIAACADIIKAGRETERNAAIAHYNLGIAYAAQREYDHAIANFGHAIRLDPGYAAAFAKRALAHEAKGERGRAHADFRAALSLTEAKGATRSAEEQWDAARRSLGVANSAGLSAPQITLDLPLPDIPGPLQFDTAPPASSPKSVQAPVPARTPSQAPLKSTPQVTIDLPPPELPDRLNSASPCRQGGPRLPQPSKPLSFRRRSHPTPRRAGIAAVSHW